MIEIFASVAGRVKVLAASIAAIAAKVTANVDVNVSTRAPASTALTNTVWTDALATKLASPVLGKSPVAGGIVASTTILQGTVTLAPTSSSGTNSTTTFSDVVNVSGSGYINLLAVLGGSYNGLWELIIDGVTIITGTSSAGWWQVPIASIGAVKTWNGTAVLSYNTITDTSPIYFNSSLVVKIKALSAGGTGCAAYFKYVKTS